MVPIAATGPLPSASLWWQLTLRPTAMAFPAADPPAFAVSPAHRTILLELAREALRQAAGGADPLRPDPAAYPPEIGQTNACFVTLTTKGELRGCIGTLVARRPLVVEVAHMARAAAIEDPRFPPVRVDEVDRLAISISVLSPATPLVFRSEADLVAKLRPHVDGLILRDQGHSGTFLPSVWDKLADPGEFWRQLKRKAGLPTNHWSDTLTVERYTTESFSDE